MAVLIIIKKNLSDNSKYHYNISSPLLYTNGSKNKNNLLADKQLCSILLMQQKMTIAKNSVRIPHRFGVQRISFCKYKLANTVDTITDTICAIHEAVNVYLEGALVFVVREMSHTIFDPRHPVL